MFDVQKLLPPLPTCFLESKSSLIKAIADSEIFTGSGKTVRRQDEAPHSY